MRKCEYKKKYSPTLGKHVYKHVYGEGIYDVLSGLRRKLMGKTAQKVASKVASKVAKKAASTALDKTGNYMGNKAGDQIVKLLHGKPGNAHQTILQSTINENTPLSDQEVNERVQRLLSGSGKIRKLRT